MSPSSPGTMKVVNVGLNKSETDWFAAKEMLVSNLKRNSLLRCNLGNGLHRNSCSVRCPISLCLAEGTKRQDSQVPLL